MRQTHISSDSKVKSAEQRSFSQQRQWQQTNRQRPETHRQGRQQSDLEHDAARDMGDIDSRLLALQQFLLTAKSLT